MINDIQGTYWINYDVPYSNIDIVFDDNPGQYLDAFIRDGEQEIPSPFITDYKYISGGIGEDRQYLGPNGEILNHPEVKTDEKLPSYCDPPNPCPLGFEANDCDASPMAMFTPEYSRLYQSEQNCQCDNDHDQCSANIILNFSKLSNRPTHRILKRPRRIWQVCSLIF